MIRVRIIEADYKKGFVKVVPEDQDDLWILYNIIKEGDIVRAQTTREIKSEGGSSRRIPMTLSVKVKTLEFQPFTERLRIRGIVVEGPDRFGVKGHYHTLNIDPGTPLIIIKEYWPRHLVERLEKSTKTRARVLVTALDYDDAAIALVSEQGLRILYEETSRLPGKSDPESFDKGLKKFIESLVQKTMDYVNRDKIDTIIVGSPGDLKKEVIKLLKEAGFKGRIYMDSVSMGGSIGVNELIRRDIFKKAMKEASIVQAENILDEFKKLLSKNPDMIAYGIDDVEYSVKMNAVAKLVVSEELIRVFDEKLRRRIEQILDEAYKRRADIVIVPSSSDVNLEIMGLGGIIAVLRYPLKREI